MSQYLHYTIMWSIDVALVEDYFYLIIITFLEVIMKHKVSRN